MNRAARLRSFLNTDLGQIGTLTNRVWPGWHGLLCLLSGEPLRVRWDADFHQIEGQDEFEREDRRLVALSVSKKQCLSFDVVFPSMPEREIVAAIRLNFSRWAPFEADEVFFALGGRRSVGDQWCHEVHYLPKQVLKPALDALAECGLAVDLIKMGSDLAKPIVLQPSATVIKIVRQMIVPALAATAVLLGMLCLVLWVQRLDRREEALRAHLGAVNQEIRRIEGQLAQAPTPVSTIDISGALGFLSKALPAEVELQEIEITGSGLRIGFDERFAASIQTALGAHIGKPIEARLANRSGRREITIPAGWAR